MKLCAVEWDGVRSGLKSLPLTQWLSRISNARSQTLTVSDLNSYGSYRGSANSQLKFYFFNTKGKNLKKKKIHILKPVPWNKLVFFTFYIISGSSLITTLKNQLQKSNCTDLDMIYWCFLESGPVICLFLV